MPFARIATQDAGVIAYTTSVVKAYPAATTPGNLLVAVVSAYGTVASVVAATIPGWTLAKYQIFGTIGGLTVLYKISTGDTSVTASLSAATSMYMQIYEFQGALATLVVDSGNSSSTVGITRTTGIITTTKADDLIFVACATFGAVTTQSWATATILSTAIQNRLFCGQYIPNAILTAFADTGSWVTSANAALAIVAFKNPVKTGGLLEMFS